MTAVVLSYIQAAFLLVRAINDLNTRASIDSGLSPKDQLVFLWLATAYLLCASALTVGAVIMFRGHRMLTLAAGCATIVAGVVSYLHNPDGFLVFGLVNPVVVWIVKFALPVLIIVFAVQPAAGRWCAIRRRA